MNSRKTHEQRAFELLDTAKRRGASDAALEPLRVAWQKTKQDILRSKERKNSRSKSATDVTRSLIRSVLYPGGDINHEWSPDTIEDLNHVLRGRTDVLARDARGYLAEDESAADLLDLVARLVAKRTR